ncbi:MAG: hypothetical protein ACRDHO_16250 [Actinomycetota bacterium]
MGETSDRVQDALAAYLDYLEMGGTQPDTSHLTQSEQHELQELIGALQLTEGVAFGLGRDERMEPGEPSPGTVAKSIRPGLSELLRSQLRESLPADVRIEPEPTPTGSHVGGVQIADRWIVGTFGGRLRVWLLAIETAQDLEGNRDCLADLNRVFGALSDTTAVVLVAEDLSCLIVQPEDCAPQINIPSGSLVGRRYKQPVQPVSEAVSEFLRELIPNWDPIPAFDRDPGLTIDVSAVGGEFVTAAIEKQRGIGQRARKGNPKKDALLTLGSNEISALSTFANGLIAGSVEPEDLEQEIDRLAKDQ